MADGYFNTTNLEGTDLVRARIKAEGQQRVIVDLIRDNDRDEGWTPSQVWQALGCLMPITSVRRAMTVATKEGALTRLDDKRKGPWGAAEHAWRYNWPNNPQLTLI